MINKIQFIAACGLMILLASCGNSGQDKKIPDQPVEKKYTTMALEPHMIQGKVQLPGVMQPFQFVQIFPKVNGFVKDVLVDRGTVVKNGTLLIRLEAPELEQKVAASKLTYTQARAMYLTSKDRYMRLLETSKTPGTISPYDLSAAESKMQADSATSQGEYANYKAEQDMYAYLSVYATFDGVITERNVHPGALVGPGSDASKPMLILQQQSKLRLVVAVPEQYSAQINNGEMVHYKVNALPGQDFSGAISRSSGNLNSNFRSETIEVDVLNPKNLFKPGMYAEVTLPISGSANAFVVPKSAVVTTTERKYVITANEGIAKWVDVTEGNQQNDSTEIFGRLQQGDKVITNASYQVKDGQKF